MKQYSLSELCGWIQAIVENDLPDRYWVRAEIASMSVPVFKTLSAKYKLVVATKGDLLDQERKLNKSGLTKYLHHIEIMSEKNIRGYKTLMRRLGVMPQEFLMVGNSLKSDIMPVVKLGARAVWIPYSLTWQHENLATDKLSNGFIKMDKIADLLKIL